MGNQARQRQELELWQVVSPPEGQNRQARQKRMVNTGKTRTAEPTRTRSPRVGEPVRARNPRPAEPARKKRPRTAEPIKTGNTRAGRLQTVEPIRIGNTRAGRLQTVEPIRCGNTRAGATRQSDTVRRSNLGTAAVMQTAARHSGRSNAQELRRQKVRCRQRYIYRSLAVMWIMVLAMTVFFMGKMLRRNAGRTDSADNTFYPVLNELPAVVDKSDAKKPDILEDFLTVSEYNRPGTKLGSVNNIFVHYTANPKTSAAQNRSYFENLGETHERAASAHFIIGYEGEIIQCIPLEEEAYAVVDRNKDSISIECCFIEEDGSFTQETYDSLIAMLVWLTDKYHLETKDILRHYDCGGKRCPLYYVEHEDAWERLLYDVEHYKL